MPSSDRSSTSEKQIIIGAGPVGLAMADALLRKKIEFDIVDANSGVGGNWLNGVYRSAHIVSSKKATQYCNYPMPESYPDFPSSDEMLRYLQNFAKDKGLLEFCEFDKTVAHIHPIEKNKWSVNFKDGEKRIYKGVIVCNGHHWDKRYPNFNGKFSGEILHSKDYQNPSQFYGKRILVIGGGNSGVDMACDAGRFGRSCDISLKSGYWYLPKTFLGRPLTDLPIWGLPIFIQRALLKSIIWISIGDYRRYGLKKPNHKIFERHPSFGTDLLSAIRLGRVRPRPDIEYINGHTVKFVDGTSGDYDLIVAATGFFTSFPFLPEGLVQVKSNVVHVYAGAFPAGLRGLYIVGWAQARNGFGRLITPLSDLYAHMIAFQDELNFPLGTLMEKSFLMNLPTTHLVDPEKTRRKIKQAYFMLPILKIRDRIMSKLRYYNEKSGKESKGSLYPSKTI